MHMKDIEEEYLTFVVRHYKAHKYDPNKAFKKFKKITGSNNNIKHKTLRIISVAASIAIIIGVLIVYNYYEKTKNLIVVASAGQCKTVKLEDGSKIILSPYSSFTYNIVEMEKGDRTVKLVGKAFFSIHHDEKHPFSVDGKVGKVKILGTVFQVDEQNKNTSTVYVVSGKVYFSGLNSNKGVLLTKGMKATLTGNKGKPLIVSSGNINQTAWATGVFKFNNTPINEALGDISEYYHVNIIASDTTKCISGEFEATNMNDVVDLLESTLGIKIQINK